MPVVDNNIWSQLLEVSLPFWCSKLTTVLDIPRCQFDVLFRINNLVEYMTEYRNIR